MDGGELGGEDSVEVSRVESDIDVEEVIAEYQKVQKDIVRKAQDYELERSVVGGEVRGSGLTTPKSDSKIMFSRTSVPYSGSRSYRWNPAATTTGVRSFSRVSRGGTDTLLHTLKSENSLLRGELESVTQYARQLRHDVQRMKTEREQDTKMSVRRESSVETQRLRRDLSEARALLRREDGINKKSVSEEGEMTINVKRLCVQVSRELNRMAEDVEGLQKEVLPTSDVAESLPLSRSSSNSDQFGIWKGMTRIERGVRAVRLAVSAQSGTYSLLRKKLKEENRNLRTELEEMKAKRREEELVLKDEMMEKERENLREDYILLEEAYEEKLKRLEERSVDAEERLLSEVEKRRKLELQIQEVESECISANNGHEEIRKALESDERARARLAGELCDERKKYEILSCEHEDLKLSQKFIPSGGFRPGEEQKELLRTMDRLLKENSGLKKENTRMTSELERNKVSLASAAAEKSMTEKEVLMAANDEIGMHGLQQRMLNQMISESTDDEQ